VTDRSVDPSAGARFRAAHGLSERSDRVRRLRRADGRQTRARRSCIAFAATRRACPGGALLLAGAPDPRLGLDALVRSLGLGDDRLPRARNERRGTSMRPSPPPMSP
jgi:hypothetical protein